MIANQDIWGIAPLSSTRGNCSHRPQRGPRSSAFSPSPIFHHPEGLQATELVGPSMTQDIVPSPQLKGSHGSPQQLEMIKRKLCVSQNVSWPGALQGSSISTHSARQPRLQGTELVRIMLSIAQVWGKHLHALVYREMQKWSKALKLTQGSERGEEENGLRGKRNIPPCLLSPPDLLGFVTQESPKVKHKSQSDQES